MNTKEQIEQLRRECGELRPDVHSVNRKFERMFNEYHGYLKPEKEKTIIAEIIYDESKDSVKFNRVK